MKITNFSFSLAFLVVLISNISSSQEFSIDSIPGNSSLTVSQKKYIGEKFNRGNYLHSQFNKLKRKNDLLLKINKDIKVLVDELVDESVLGTRLHETRKVNDSLLNIINALKLEITKYKSDSENSNSQQDIKGD